MTTAPMRATTERTVLVVEDQALLRFMTMDVIADSGFAVIGAANSREAMAIIDMRPDIRLVFSDIDMPGDMDGEEMAARLAISHVDMSVILTSGKVPSRGIRIPTHGAFLPKPYMPEDISKLLHSLSASH